VPAVSFAVATCDAQKRFGCLERFGAQLSDKFELWTKFALVFVQNAREILFFNN